jgi:RNA 2',3'-cyclic 3'-phosphodiesterase
MQQYAFDFIRDEPWRPKRPERIFFGLLPHPETTESINRFRDRFFTENEVPGRPLGIGRLHVSLHHAGDFKRLPSSVVYAAKLAGEAVSMRTFEAVFERVMSFEAAPSKKAWPLVLLGKGDAFFELHGILGAEMRRIGLRAMAGFTPHMTLLYGPRKIPPQPIEPIRAVFDEFVLIHSERGLTRYNILGRWPLNA